jgi:hypothetical protein
VKSSWRRAGAAFAAFLVLGLLVISCGSPEYRVFSLREGIGQFSMEYPPDYTVTRLDIRNDAANRYTDVGLSASQAAPGSLGEISVYAWPAAGNEAATQILEDILGRAGAVFAGFRVLERSSVMIGDIEGQAAEFSWDAAASANATGPSSLPAVSSMVCFRHGDIAWEIHVATDAASREQASARFEHIIETFQILD